MIAYVIALLKYWAWQLLTKGLFGLVYIGVTADGLRAMSAILSTKLYRVPFLGLLRDYEDTHRLDPAIVLSLVLLVATWLLWGHILDLFLTPEESPAAPALGVRRHRFLVITGIIVLGFDAMCFYLALIKRSWGGSVFSFPALMALYCLSAF